MDRTKETDPKFWGDQSWTHVRKTEKTKGFLKVDLKTVGLEVRAERTEPQVQFNSRFLKPEVNISLFFQMFLVHQTPVPVRQNCPVPGGEF